MVLKLSQDQRHAMVHEWQVQLRGLLDQVEQWADTEGWTVTRDETAIQEDGLPDYHAQRMEIRLGDERRVYLEPVARITLNGRGVAELYAWPSLRRVRLQPGTSPGQSWIVMTDSGIPLHQEWNRKNFLTLVGDLVA